MKKTLVLGAVAALTFPAVAAEMKTSWSGYAQVTGQSGEGTNSSTKGRGLKFGLGKVRTTAKAAYMKSSVKVQLDYDHANSQVDVKDAVLGYKCKMDLFNLSLGVFKTQVGMDSSVSSKSKAIAGTNTMDELTTTRDTGAAIHGTIMKGLTYQVGFYNGANEGTDNDLSAMVAYDMNNLHVEAGVYTAGNSTAGNSAADNHVMDFGAAYTMGAIGFEAEYMAAENVGGTKGVEATSMYFQATYKAMDNLQAVVRHSMNDWENTTAKTESEISNTYIGANYWVEKNSRIQLNYVVVSGNDREHKATATDLAWSSTGLSKAYTANALLANFQVRF
jgi:hypothetical protein